MKGLFKIVVGLAVTAVFVWLTLRGVDFAELGAVLRRVETYQVALGLIFIALAYTVRVVRWQTMLRCFRPEIGFGQTAGPFVASFAINNLAPLRAGDIARIFAFERQIGVQPSRVAATLIVERLLDLLALLIILAFGLSFAPAIDPVLRDVASTALGFAIAALFVVFMVPRWIYRVLLVGYRSNLLRGIAPLRIIVRFGMRLMHALQRLSNPLRFVGLLTVSLVSWVLEGGVFFAVALHASISPMVALVPLGAATMMTLVPSTPGHIGTFHFGAKLGYLSLGLPIAEATAAAVLAHLIVWLPVTVAGGIWLLAYTSRDRLLRRQTQD